jgi:hypothetical protein
MASCSRRCGGKTHTKRKRRGRKGAHVWVYVLSIVVLLLARAPRLLVLVTVRALRGISIRVLSGLAQRVLALERALCCYDCMRTSGFIFQR